MPPALTITDEPGAIWTLGFRFGAAPRGEFAFNVLRNGQETGEIASRIERRKGQVRIFTAQGWKRLFTTKMEETVVYGIGAKLRRALPAGAGLAIEVSIYWDGQPEVPLCRFMFDAQCGGGSMALGSPGAPVIGPGQWLTATITPAVLAAEVQVMASVGDQVLREVPVVNEHVKEQNHA